MPSFRSDKRSIRRFGRVIRFDGGIYETTDLREVAWLRGREDVEEVPAVPGASADPPAAVEPDEAATYGEDSYGDQPDETE